MMTVIQAFCCSIVPAFTGLVAGYVIMRIGAKAIKGQNDHNNLD